MALTNPKVIRGLEDIRTSTNVKFRTFGLFFIKLLFLPIRDQEFIVGKLLYAARHARDRDAIEVISFRRAPIELAKHERQFRFILEHTFMCTLCDNMSSGETNCASGFFASNCEVCQERSADYQSDSVANQLYD